MCNDILIKMGAARGSGIVDFIFAIGKHNYSSAALGRGDQQVGGAVSRIVQARAAQIDRIHLIDRIDQTVVIGGKRFEHIDLIVEADHGELGFGRRIFDQADRGSFHSRSGA